MYDISVEVKMPPTKDEEIEILKQKISLLESQIHVDTEANLEKLETSRKKQIDFLDSELSCSICFEVFVKPIRLPCLHPFCQTCILQHQQNQRVCPLCRAKYTSVGRLDNCLSRCIENIIEFSYTQNEKTERAKLVATRQRLEKQLEDIKSGNQSDIDEEQESFWGFWSPPKEIDLSASLKSFLNHFNIESEEESDIVILMLESDVESFWSYIFQVTDESSSEETNEDLIIPISWIFDDVEENTTEDSRVSSSEEPVEDLIIPISWLFDNVEENDTEDGRVFSSEETDKDVIISISWLFDENQESDTAIEGG